MVSSPSFRGYSLGNVGRAGCHHTAGIGGSIPSRPYQVGPQKRRPGLTEKGLGQLLLPIMLVMSPVANAEKLNFQSADWTTECDLPPRGTDSDCSIIGVFGTTLPDGTKGSYSLLIDLAHTQIAVVGRPAPTQVSIRIDKNSTIECSGTPYCIFSSADDETITRELNVGSLILVDVVAGKKMFRMSLSASGYRAGLAKINAQAPGSTAFRPIPKP